MNQVKRYIGEVKDKDLVYSMCQACKQYEIPGTAAREKVTWIACEKCSSWFHLQCVKVPANFDIDNDEFTCRNCENAAVRISSCWVGKQTEVYNFRLDDRPLEG